MRKNLSIIFVLFALSLNARERLQISLLTTNPGDLPHTLFGHSALRVNIAGDDFDKIYNFGLFNFSTPNFGLKFLGGELEYWLGRQTVEGFIEVNNKEGRQIKEQLLNLSAEQASSIFSILMNRHESKEKFYRYSFTAKNCTSEIRDILAQEGIIKVGGEYDLTYREILAPYTRSTPWFDFAIDLITGMEMDRPISYEESLFLPAELERAIEQTEGLVIENNVLNDPPVLVGPSILSKVLSPIVIFSLITILTFYWSPKWLRLSLYFIMGALGSTVLYLSLTSLHSEIQANMNVLWCNPLYLFLFVLGPIKRSLKWLNYLLIGCTAIALFVWLFQFQSFHWAVLPLMVMMIAFNVKDLRKSVSKG
jgi:hypothetical protein